MPEIKYRLTDEGTAVEKEWCIIKWVTGLMVFLCVWDSNVLFGGFDELLSELLLEVRVGSIDLDVFEVLIEFKLVEFFLLELFEGVLNGYAWGMFGEDLVLFIGGVGIFHNFKFYLNEFD